MKKAILSAAVAAMVLTPAALANDHGDKFSKMDTNGDASVTEAEFVAYVTADGEVSGDEASLQFAVLAGQDGVLTREEFDAAMADHTDHAESGDATDGQ